MPEILFTDSEISVINAVLTKSDPCQLIAEAQSALAKIRAYAEQKAKQGIEEVERGAG